MSKESDTAMIMEYRKTVINNNKSFDMCKECASAHVCNNQLLCKEDSPTVENCNLLKMFYNF